MNRFSKYLLILTAIFLILVVLTNLNLVNAEIESGVIVNGSKYSNEPIEINIASSGSKALNGIDNLVGAKNKVVTLDNKDKYIINHYIDDSNNTYELIYGNGVQNNPTNTKEAYVNGELTKMPRFYGKDGITNLTIVYDEYLHSEETVVFNNTVGDRFTTITNNLGVNDTWSNNGKIFDNQISGLEFVNTAEGNYTFKYWVDEAGEIVHNFFVEWENGARRIYNFFAVYDFAPNPVVNNTTDDNSTVPVENDTTENITDNTTNENTANDNSNDNITNTTLPINNSNSTNINLDNSNSTMQDNKTTLTNKEKTNNTTVALNKKTGISFFSLVGIVILVYMLLCLKRKYN